MRHQGLIRRLTLQGGIVATCLLLEVACSDHTTTGGVGDGSTSDASGDASDGNTGCDGPCTGLPDASADAIDDFDPGHVYCTEDPTDMFECFGDQICCVTKDLCYDPQSEPDFCD